VNNAVENDFFLDFLS